MYNIEDYIESHRAIHILSCAIVLREDNELIPLSSLQGVDHDQVVI